uniref:Uncharacterized protein n=1 Tax=Theropithecus gelada TaxID=9565 RepID=A0A8D2GCH7_THEGE
MMCICHLETGSQSINVCANFLFPPQPPSPYDFIYVGCVLSNDGMTTLFHVLKVLLSCRAPELMVALGLELCLTGLLPRKPVWCVLQEGTRLSFCNAGKGLDASVTSHKAWLQDSLTRSDKLSLRVFSHCQNLSPAVRM